MIETQIHLQWDGPLSLGELSEYISDHHIGLYQIYAHHPVYGHSLVYIGRTHGQSFGRRIGQEKWGEGSESDPNSIEVYVGRIKEHEMSDEEWVSRIEAAEALLIHAHAPAYNSTYILSSPKPEKVGHIRVLNWGAVRSLSREVSGLMWSARGLESRALPIYTGASEGEALAT